MSTDIVFDQYAIDPDTVPVNETTLVYLDEPIGWAYLCRSDRCTHNASGQTWHGLSGYVTRALAVDAATQHVDAVRARRAVIA